MNLICGINPVLEALHAGTRHFERLLVVKGLRNQRISEAVTVASRLGVPLRFESRETLDRLSAGVPHQGIMAVVSAKPVMDLEDLLGQTRDPALLVALDGVEDPRNLGAILRTAEAAGADGVLLPERRSAGLTEVVGRASAGALEHVRVARVPNMAQGLVRLKERGIWVVGFDAAGTERWDAVDLKRPVALVLGGEGRGIRRLVRESCDHLVSLPLFGHVGSLNVSVAAGIALYEVIRQRGLVPSHVRPIPPRPSAVAPVSGIQGPRADDEELDPGQFAPGEAEGGEPPEGAEGGPVVRLHDEELAWGAGGATVVRGGVERRGEWGRRGRRERDQRDLRGRKKKRGRPGEPPAAPGEGGAPVAARPDEVTPVERATGPGGPGRKRRRRGRKRGPEGGPGPGGPPREGEGARGPERRERPPRPAQPGQEGRESSGAPRPESGSRADAEARRKRRRRRRRGPGTGPGPGAGGPPAGGSEA